MLSKFKSATEENEAEDFKYRMYFLHKLGFLDTAIWSSDITQEQRATMLRKILNGNPIRQSTVTRYYKLFAGTGSHDLRRYEEDNEDGLLNYLRRICPKKDFQKGRFINNIKKA